MSRHSAVSVKVLAVVMFDSLIDIGHNLPQGLLFILSVFGISATACLEGGLASTRAFSGCRVLVMTSGPLLFREEVVQSGS